MTPYRGRIYNFTHHRTATRLREVRRHCFRLLTAEIQWDFSGQRLKENRCITQWNTKHTRNANLGRPAARLHYLDSPNRQLSHRYILPHCFTNFDKIDEYDRE